MLAMDHYHVISQRVTTTDLVTTLFANNLSTTAVMLPLQVVEYNAIPEKNKTKQTNKWTVVVHCILPIFSNKIYPTDFQKALQASKIVSSFDQLLIFQRI